MTSAPDVDTARLRLRAHRPDDFEALATMWSAPEVTRFIGGKGFTREEVWSRLLRSAGHWALLGFGYWVATLRETNEFVGEVGFADFRRDLEPKLVHPEMGWALTPRFHRSGLATEAIAGLLTWADANLEADRTVCLIDVGNTTSVAVARRAGFVKRLSTTYHGTPTELFERLRPARV